MRSGTAIGLTLDICAATYREFFRRHLHGRQSKVLVLANALNSDITSLRFHQNSQVKD
jgi:hypothetical protein